MCPNNADAMAINKKNSDQTAPILVCTVSPNWELYTAKNDFYLDMHYLFNFCISNEF